MQVQVGDPWASALAQLTGACGDGASMRALGWLDGVPREEKAVRYNPRPPGVVRFGSTVHAVWAVIEAQPHRWFERYELIHLTLGSRKAVDWALIYLERLGSLDVSRPDFEALHGFAHPTELMIAATERVRGALRDAGFAPR